MHRPNLNTLKNIKRQSVVLMLSALLTAVSASADDLEIYDSSLARPKVLFVLDTSGSMSSTDGGNTSRISRMKSALSTLLANIQAVDVGLMEYSGRAIRLIHPVGDVVNNQASLQAAAAGLKAGGGTPTVAALYEAQRYLTGNMPYRGNNGGQPYVSPTKNQCESNHVVLLTDGRPTPDLNAVNDLQPLLGGCASRTADRGTCGVELSEYLATEDQFPNIPNNPEPNTITTHSIGFNIRDDWLESLATVSNGIYRNAASSQELLAAFQSILNSVQLNSTTAAPTVSVNAFNQSRHREDLYYSFFQPGGAPRWEGNIKKYRLRDGVIVDYYDQPVITGGRISETSVSLWSKDANGARVPDGAMVAHGGMAARQPAGRKWYTDAGIARNAIGGVTPALVAADNQIARQWYGATSNAERNKLSQWVRGYDSLDRDGNTDFIEPNRYVADSIHSSPVLVSYKAKETTNLLHEVLYSATNMGVLHAIDPETGDEIWSYSPEELLPNIKQYVDNTSRSHVYGLDGEIVSHVTYKANTTFDFETDTVKLYLTQRRGGSNIFALDVSDTFSNTNPVKRLWTVNGGVAGTDFRDMAQTWSTPQLIPIKYGCPTNCATKEVLLVGGGYNPDYDNKNLAFPVTPKSTGHGNAVYLIDPDNGSLIWSAGNGTHHDLNLAMNDSVPATPIPVDTDADGIVNVLFFSDIAGHIWRIDLEQEAESAAKLAIAGGKIASLNETGEALRFFNRLDVSINGVTNGTAQFNLVTGSGMRSSPIYKEPVNNRLFAIRDNWVFGNPTAKDPVTGDIVPDYRYVTNPSNSNRAVITPSDLWEFAQPSTSGPTAYGFYRTLEHGEKVLQPTLTHGNRVFLTSYMPHDPNNIPNPCTYQIGESRLYIMDIESTDNKLSVRFGSPYAVIGSGILAGGTIVDTGDNGGPDLVVGINSAKLVDLLDPDNPNVFRRFYRTGWSELDSF